MKKRLDNSIMLRNEQSKKKGEEMETAAKRLAEILIRQIEFNKNKCKKYEQSNKKSNK